MTHETDEEWYGEDQVAPRRRRRAPLVFAFTLLAVLAIAAAGAAYFWFFTDKSIAASTPEAAANAEATPADKPVLTDLLASQERTSADIEALNQSVAAQEAQLKAIADQLSALTSRVDALQSAAAAPPPPPPPPQPAAPPESREQVIPKRAAKKPAHASKPAGPISVGGAPLTTTPGANGH